LPNKAKSWVSCESKYKPIFENIGTMPKTTIDLPDELRKNAKKHGVNMSFVSRAAIEKAVERAKKLEAALC